MTPTTSPSFRLAEITIDCRDPATVGAFWSSLLGAPLRVPLEGWLRLGPLTEGGPVLNFQPVPELKQGKTRTHLDLLTDDLDAAIATVHRLGGRGPDQRHVYDEGTVVVMADPEGNEFCVVWHAPGTTL
jgi:predicted enzyme related to lactoylglutathione lyase